MQKRVFVDMDGVLCRYNTEATVSDLETDGYFRTLPARPLMVNAVKTLIKSGLADVFILSSVLSQREKKAKAEKNDWLDENIPEIRNDHRIFPICGTNKAEAVGEIGKNDILCDDHTPNLLDWVESGGKAVKILNEINGNGGTFMMGPRLTIKYPEELSELIFSM